MPRLLFAAALALTLSACQTTAPHKITGAFPATGNFGDIVIPWSSGSKTTIKVQQSSKNGTLNICGYYYNEGRIHSHIEEAWIKKSSFIVTLRDGTEARFPGHFLAPHNPESQGLANMMCVETEIDREEATNVRIDGPRRVNVRI